MNYDSILTAVDSTPLMRSEHYAIGQNAPDIGIAMSERGYAVANDDWIVGGLIVLGLLLMLIVCRGWRLLGHHFNDFFSTKPQDISDTLKDTATEVAGVLLLATISALSLSVIYFNDLSEQCEFNPVLDIPYWVIGLGFAAIVSFIYLKAWLYHIVNWTFFDPESRRNWAMRYFFLTSLTAFSFYPLALVDVLVPTTADVATWGVILTLIVYEILLFYRLLTNFIAPRALYIPFLLYFCAVELIPVLIVWKGLGWMTDDFIVKHIIH